MILPGWKEAVSAERLAPATLDDLREEVAGPREAEATEGPAPVTLEALEAWGDKLVSRVAEAARDPRTHRGTRLRRVCADHIGRIEDAAAKAEAAAERIDKGLASTADRVVAKIEGAVTTMNEGLAKTRAQVIQQSRQADPILEDILTQTAGLKFGWRAILLFLTFFVLGMLLESRIHILYNWL